MAAFHVDEKVSYEITLLLRNTRHSVADYNDLGMRDAPDYDHLFLATSEGRVLLTNNWSDFELLHGAWRRWSSVWGGRLEHAGILVLDQHAPARDVVAAILALERQGWPLRNELYRWRRGRRWQRFLWQPNAQYL